MNTCTLHHTYLLPRATSVSPMYLRAFWWCGFSFKDASKSSIALLKLPLLAYLKIWRSTWMWGCNISKHYPVLKEWILTVLPVQPDPLYYEDQCWEPCWDIEKLQYDGLPWSDQYHLQHSGMPICWLEVDGALRHTLALGNGSWQQENKLWKNSEQEIIQKPNITNYVSV